MKPNVFLLTAFCLCMMFSCRKESSHVEGFVTDIRTGKPIPGTYIDSHWLVDGKDGDEHWEEEHFTSDSKGHFEFTLPQDASLDFQHKDYLSDERLSTLVPDPMDVRLYPLSPLQIDVTNTTGQHDSIFVVLENKLASEYLEPHSAHFNYFTSEHPIKRPPGASFHQTFFFPYNELTYVYWGYCRFDWHLNAATFRDSVLLLPNDTTHFFINY